MNDQQGPYDTMDGIEIQEYRVGALQDIVLLEAGGYIDTNTSPELQKVLNHTIESGNYQIVVDMSDVQYVSSAGWGVFVGEIRRLKEKGGDLKLTCMTPEVNEVFEMLEFHRILSAYDRTEEAIEDFDFYRDVVLPPQNGRTEPLKAPVAAPAEAPKPTDVLPAEPVRRMEVRPSVYRSSPEVDEKRLPVSEKIKRIVLENPLLGIWGVKKMLFSPRFGFTQIGLLELYSMMKKLNLHTKAKRCRYYRSR